jgi:antitoxin component YwqK of YwqJK toxin-antitoxin module
MKSFSFLLLFLVVSFTLQAQCTSGDCKNGFGVYKWSDGDKYEGDWKNGKFEGKGKYYYSNGSTFEGKYKLGKKHGEGVFIKKNGDEYEGLWQHGKRVVKTNTILKQWLPGKWKGKGYQDGGKTWNVVLNYVNKDDIRISYPDFPCSGFWYFEKENDHQIFFKEKIIKGQSNCRPGTRIIIEKAYKDQDGIMGVYFFQGSKQIGSANIVKQ